MITHEQCVAAVAAICEQTCAQCNGPLISVHHRLVDDEGHVGCCHPDPLPETDLKLIEFLVREQLDNLSIDPPPPPADAVSPNRSLPGQAGDDVIRGQALARDLARKIGEIEDAHRRALSEMEAAHREALAVARAEGVAAGMQAREDRAAEVERLLQDAAAQREHDRERVREADLAAAGHKAGVLLAEQQVEMLNQTLNTLRTLVSTLPTLQGSDAQTVLLAILNMAPPPQPAVPPVTPPVPDPPTTPPSAPAQTVDTAPAHQKCRAKCPRMAHLTQQYVWKDGKPPLELYACGPGHDELFFRALTTNPKYVGKLETPPTSVDDLTARWVSIAPATTTNP